MKSYDPRMNRITLPYEPAELHQEAPLGQWPTFEVFQQQSRGQQHVHVGVVHAPNSEMALVFAKEQFGRREQCANLWVVKSADVHATDYEDADMFQHAFDKSYRESDGYRVKDTIELFQRDLEARLLSSQTKTSADATPVLAETVAAGNCQVVRLPDLGKGHRKILIKK